MSSMNYWDVPVDEELEHEQKQVKLDQSASGVVDKSRCELIYGPYPFPYPIPMLDKKTFSIVPKSTTSLFDIPIDYRDKKTIDHWIPRDGRLPRHNTTTIRPPSSSFIGVEGKDEGLRTESVLNDFEFVTSPALLYVSNHSAVPKLEWESMTLTVSMVNDRSTQKVVLTMEEVLSLRPRKEFPITLVSASLRRAELHALRSTNIISTHDNKSNSNATARSMSRASCIGTQIYKGVYLRSLLKHVGITQPRANYWVVAKGADGYSISIPLGYCCNAASSILLAYVVNGEPLLPDHGYPLRLVVPGWIGAYSVKWLQELCITKVPVIAPEQCLLPPNFPLSEKDTISTWMKYRMTEASLQCIITTPKNDYRIRLPQDLNSTIQVGGFAYAGGGRAVTRVEISFDEGCTWTLVHQVHRKELTTIRDQRWCWQWWCHEVRVDALMKHRSTIRCRAWDSANNVQPETPTWNACGVGANHVYAVRLTPSRTDKTIILQHPIAAEDRGWLKSPSNLPYAAGYGVVLHHEDTVIGEAIPVADQILCIDDDVLLEGVDVNDRRDNNDDDDSVSVKSNQSSIFSVDSECASWVELKASLVPQTGEDIAIPRRRSSMFGRGSAAAQQQRRPSLMDPYHDHPTLYRSALADGCGRVSVYLQQKVVLSSDSILLDFSLPTADHFLGLPVGMHVFVAVQTDNGRSIKRPYTPVSSDNDRGRVQFVIKVYRASKAYPNGGVMSQFLDQLQIGDSIEIRGPAGDFQYYKNGVYSILDNTGYAKHINMIAGGTGVTPMIQSATHIIRNQEDSTSISMIYACREESDLLLRSVLDQWADLFSNRFRIHYILSDSWPSDWKFSTGFVDAMLFAKHLYPPDKFVLNIACGPPIFLTKGCTAALLELGHSRERIYSF